MTQRLVIRCDLNPGVGYTLHALQTARWLDTLGVYASIRPLSENGEFGELPLDMRARVVRGPQPEPWELTIAPPLHRPTPGKQSALFTMWESSVLPGPQVEMANLYDLVIVPCEWCRQTFVASGVKAPVLVVPLGCEMESMGSRGSRVMTVFVAAGRTAHGRERKGLDAVLRCFTAAFPYDPEVRLEIKCYPDCQLAECQDERVTVHRRHWTDLQVAGWLHGADCFVSAACGEGFGLWQLQAMAAGLPLICAAYGGLREFVGPHNAYLVRYRVVPSSEHFGGSWAQPDLGAMVEAMRYVQGHREDARQLGRFAAETVNGFTWENSARQLVQVLAMAGALTARRQAFAKPALHHLEYGPAAQESLEAQAARQGFEIEELKFEQKQNEAVFNPSVALVKGELLWFGRRSKMTNGDRPDSRIFAFREADQQDGVLPLAARQPIYLPQLFGDAFEDPRAQAFEDGVALSYSRVSRGRPACQELALLDGEFNVKEVLHLDYGGNGMSSTDSTKTEKNWVWFPHDGQWYCIYWLEPMTVLGKVGAFERVCQSANRYEGWRHGVRHGGGPPTRIGEEMFGFCHSLLPWYGQSRSRYFISAYAFAAEPPFAMTRLSREPFLASVDDVRSNPCSCVICGGAVHQDGQWTLAVGAADERCYKVRLSHEWLLGRMESV